MISVKELRNKSLADIKVELANHYTKLRERRCQLLQARTSQNSQTSSMKKSEKGRLRTLRNIQNELQKISIISTIRENLQLPGAVYNEVVPKKFRPRLTKSKRQALSVDQRQLCLPKTRRTLSSCRPRLYTLTRSE